MEKNYLDADIEAAFDRYVASVEFRRTRSILGEHLSLRHRILEIGAGRGLTSLALARQGFTVTSVELDPSNVVGLGALAQLRSAEAGGWSAVRTDAGTLPFRDASFDAVFCRSVLHHLEAIDPALVEILRVLKPGGVFLALNEHILGPFSTGRRFRGAHPAVAYGVNERAYPAVSYYRMLWRAGFRRIRTFGYPLDFEEFLEATRHHCVRHRMINVPGVGRLLARALHLLHIVVRRHLLVPETSLPAVSLVAEKRRENR